MTPLYISLIYSYRSDAAIKEKDIVHGFHGLLNLKTQKIIILCHPGGIYAVVETADACNCKDAYGMTIKFY